MPMNIVNMLKKLYNGMKVGVVMRGILSDEILTDKSIK